MPNNTSCQLHISGDAKIINQLMEKHFVKDDGNHTICFNSIIPMPEELKHTTEGSVRLRGIEIMKNQPSGRSMVLKAAGLPENDVISHAELLGIALDVCPDEFFEGLSALRCLETYGAKSWYDWAVDNWGTKWDAYWGSVETETCGEQMTLSASFSTAWSPASFCINELAAMYPDIAMEHHFLDEGGDFAGTEVYADGRLVSEAEHDWRHFAENQFCMEFIDEDEDEN